MCQPKSTDEVNRRFAPLTKLTCHVNRVTQSGSQDFVVPEQRIAAFGNSDGDLQMLQWTAAGKRSRYMFIVHHNDAEREWAYDRKSKIGQLDLALDEALKRGWTVVDMKKDWEVIYPFQLK